MPVADPGSPLPRLRGDKIDQYGVKVSGNRRVFLRFFNRDAYGVDYDDYHERCDIMNKMKRKPIHPVAVCLSLPVFRTSPNPVIYG